MIKIQNNTTTREALPAFLIGLLPESLADLSWTDPALGVSDCKWLPEVDQSPALAEYERYGDETLTVDGAQVIVVRAVVPWSAEEIAVHLAAMKSAKWEAIKTERDRRTQEGGYYVAPHWYHSDTFSRTQQIGLVMLGVNIPVGTMWKTLDNGMIEMTQTLASQIFSAAAASDIAIFASAEQHKAAMEASVDPAAYDFSSGWPDVYVP